MTAATRSAGLASTGSGVAPGSKARSETAPTSSICATSAPLRRAWASAAAAAVPNAQTTQRAPLHAWIASTSAGESRGVTGSAQASRSATARIIAAAARQFSATTTTRSPARTPRCASQSAAVSTACLRAA
jgi:hypothetical protein